MIKIGQADPNSDEIVPSSTIKVDTGSSSDAAPGAPTVAAPAAATPATAAAPATTPAPVATPAPASTAPAAPIESTPLASNATVDPNATATNITAPANASDPVPAENSTSNETIQAGNSSESAENITDEEGENKTAVNERMEYINSRITVKRNNSQEQLFVHIVPFSYTLGN